MSVGEVCYLEQLKKTVMSDHFNYFFTRRPFWMKLVLFKTELQPLLQQVHWGHSFWRSVHCSLLKKQSYYSHKTEFWHFPELSNNICHIQCQNAKTLLELKIDQSLSQGERSLKNLFNLLCHEKPTSICQYMQLTPNEWWEKAKLIITLSVTFWW